MPSGGEVPLQGGRFGGEERELGSRDDDHVRVRRQAFLAEGVPGGNRHVVALEHLLD